MRPDSIGVEAVRQHGVDCLDDPQHGNRAADGHTSGADLVESGARRRIAEGDPSLADLDTRMERTRSIPLGSAPTSITGRSYRTKIQLF